MPFFYFFFTLSSSSLNISSSSINFVSFSFNFNMPPKLLLRSTSFLLLLLLSSSERGGGGIGVGVRGAAAADLPQFQFQFREAPAFRNGRECPQSPSIIHVAMTLDATYLPGSIAAVFSVLRHATCPDNIVFHFLLLAPTRAHLRRTLLSTFPYLSFQIYHFDAALVRGIISSSIRQALDQPLNYARIYLADLLPSSVRRIIYFDSDLILVDDVFNLWSIHLNGHVLGAPEYCHANFTSYFTHKFWSADLFLGNGQEDVHQPHRRRRQVFLNRKPCYFNTGVMVIDLERWRKGKYTEKVETWMRIQKKYRIYELGSLPPFLLVFAGSVEPLEHRWNQHGLGGDNVEGQCRDLHPGAVSLLHWSGKGKPWLRLDWKKPCPLDSLWAPYDLRRRRCCSSHTDEALPD